MSKKIPKVFVSYSHDSQEHKKWVLDLATRMRNQGIDAILDQWELSAGDDIPKFMEENLDQADYVLMVCTERYVDKANKGNGGVAYEKMIVTSEMLRDIDSRKIIPLIRQEGKRDLPVFLRTKKYIDFSINDDFETSYDELVRAVLNSPLYKKPKLGNRAFDPIKEHSAEQSSDVLKELMRALVREYEREEKNYVLYKGLAAKMGISRVLIDVRIMEATQKGLVATDNDGDLWLTDQGKRYAVERELISQIEANKAQ